MTGFVKALALFAVADAAVLRQEGCSSADAARRSQMGEKVFMLGVECEEMCKELGVYPNCQCPGFGGMAASAGGEFGDNRSCYSKNCQDPSNPCPNAAFVTCVKSTTKTSVLQTAKADKWETILAQVDGILGTMKTFNSKLFKK